MKNEANGWHGEAGERSRERAAPLVQLHFLLVDEDEFFCYALGECSDAAWLRLSETRISRRADAQVTPIIAPIDAALLVR